MKLAIVTGCPNGMVTSVLCARLLDAAAQRQGWSTSVEVHDPKHPERQLSAATIDEAEWVLVVSSLGVDELSVSARSIPEVKARVRELSMDRLKTLAAEALSVGSPDEVRALVEAL